MADDYKFSLVARIVMHAQEFPLAAAKTNMERNVDFLLFERIRSESCERFVALGGFGLGRCQAKLSFILKSPGKVTEADPITKVQVI
jgi:hypothetical protein